MVGTKKHAQKQNPQDRAKCRPLGGYSLSKAQQTHPTKVPLKTPKRKDAGSTSTSEMHTTDGPSINDGRSVVKANSEAERETDFPLSIEKIRSSIVILLLVSITNIRISKS